MGWAARAKPKCHYEVYWCPRCGKCFKCDHSQVGDLPERFWVCDGVKIWVWPEDGTVKFKEIV
jgi:hypothetical protein